MLRALLLPALVALQTAPAPQRPAWVERLPEAPGRLYALGTADLGSAEGQAIMRASDRARLEVVTRLRATVKGGTRVATTTTELRRDGQKAAGAGQRVVQDVVSVGAKAEDLPGMVVEQTFTDPAARTVYALAYLDLGQARAALASRIEGIRQGRVRVGDELSRKALYKLRSLTQDLDRAEAAVNLLALTGADMDLRPALQAVRKDLDKGLDRLNQADLPALDFSRTVMALRSNVDLPLNVESFLRGQVSACGLVSRQMDPDLVLDLAFTGGAKGPEFICADMDIYSGVTYRIEARMTLVENGGSPVTRSVPILIVQGESPEGMVGQFVRQVERWLPRLLGEYKSEMQ